MKPACIYRGAGDTHTEDVQAYCSFSAFLIGEVIPGELMDCCGEKKNAKTLTGEKYIKTDEGIYFKRLINQTKQD